MEKILTFVIKNHKILLLLESENDQQFHKSFWYVVTGGCEDRDKSLDDTVRREVKEETNLELNKIIDLNWTLEYDSLGKHCVEHVFVSYTNDDNICLNEESIDYKWCDLDEFIELINWHYDKETLKEKIEKYV